MDSNSGRKAHRNGQVLEEAAAWFVDFSEGEVDAAGRAAFDEWLRRSPEHVRCYLEISAFWEDAGDFGRDQALDLEALIERALAHSNVLALDAVKAGNAPPLAENASAAEVVDVAANPAPVSTEDRLKRRGARLRRFAAAASVLVMLAVAGAVAWLQGYWDPTYTTAVGEQRSVTLVDGSKVELNSRSRVRVRFTDQQRVVELLEGQALFKVAKNPVRPFIVRSGATSARAVGTQFDVYRRPDRTVVTVVEGRVAVSSELLPVPEQLVGRQPAAAGTSTSIPMPPGAGADAVLLVAGEQISVTPRVIARPRPANVEAATAWTQQKLIFDTVPLREVVAEFNRYNRVQLVIDDPGLNEFHVSGVFASTSAQSMLDFLQRRFDVVITGDEHVVHIKHATGEAGAPATVPGPP